MLLTLITALYSKMSRNPFPEIIMHLLLEEVPKHCRLIQVHHVLSSIYPCSVSSMHELWQICLYCMSFGANCIDANEWHRIIINSAEDTQISRITIFSRFGLKEEMAQVHHFNVIFECEQKCIKKICTNLKHLIQMFSCLLPLAQIFMALRIFQ